MAINNQFGQKLVSIQVVIIVNKFGFLAKIKKRRNSFLEKFCEKLSSST